MNTWRSSTTNGNPIHQNLTQYKEYKFILYNRLHPILYFNNLQSVPINQQIELNLRDKRKGSQQ